jgi:hypothetical protein
MGGEWLQAQAKFVFPRHRQIFFPAAVTKGIDATNK